MLSTLLLATFVLAAPPTEPTQVWEGKLYVEFLEAKPKRRKVERTGDVLPVTLRITRTGTSFTGEWTEGDRSLAIAGVVKRGKFEAAPTRVLKGKWNDDILKDLKFSGKFDEKSMQGLLYGAGNKRVRGGEFELEKKR
jgi:hypothetical protein